MSLQDIEKRLFEEIMKENLTREQILLRLQALNSINDVLLKRMGTDLKEREENEKK